MIHEGEEAMARQMPSRQAERPDGGRLGRWWRRLTSPGEESTSESDQPTAADEATRPIVQCGDRDKVVVSGTIAEVTQKSKGDQPKLVAEVRDGSGSVMVAWIGRRGIPGVEVGRSIRLHGRISCQQGMRTMYNPRYELLGG